MKYNLPFQALTIKFIGLTDRIITKLSISEAFNPQDASEKHKPFHSLKALWNTGATKSVITSSTVRKIGLISVGEVQVNHAGGISPSKTYLVNFLLPNQVGIMGVLVSECEDTVGAFDAIIGMDIINIGDFSISNLDKKTCMSFRTPPYSTQDFVKESVRIQFSGVKPFAPCPCGEKNNIGLPIKFSECHGKILHE